MMVIEVHNPRIDIKGKIKDRKTEWYIDYLDLDEMIFGNIVPTIYVDNNEVDEKLASKEMKEIFYQAVQNPETEVAVNDALIDFAEVEDRGNDSYRSYGVEWLEENITEIIGDRLSKEQLDDFLSKILQYPEYDELSIDDFINNSVYPEFKDVAKKCYKTTEGFEEMLECIKDDLDFHEAIYEIITPALDYYHYEAYRRGMCRYIDLYRDDLAEEFGKRIHQIIDEINRRLCQ